MIKGFFSKYLTRILGVLIVALGVTSAVMYYLYASEAKRAEDLAVTISSKDIEIGLLKANLNTVELARINDQKASDLLATAYKDQRAENKRLNDELTQYEGRSNTVIQKPSLVEYRINSATNRLFDSIECATGNCSDSGTTEVPSTTPRPDSP